MVKFNNSSVKRIRADGALVKKIVYDGKNVLYYQRSTLIPNENSIYKLIESYGTATFSNSAISTSAIKNGVSTVKLETKYLINGFSYNFPRYSHSITAGPTVSIEMFSNLVKIFNIFGYIPRDSMSLFYTIRNGNQTPITLTGYLQKIEGVVEKVGGGYNIKITVQSTTNSFSLNIPLSNLEFESLYGTILLSSLEMASGTGTYTITGGFDVCLQYLK